MSLKKRIILIILNLAFGTGSAQSGSSVTSINFSEIQPEIEWFIDKAQSESYDSGQYNVYLVKLSIQDELSYCASIEYIQDSSLVSQITAFKYYTILDGELVLIQVPDAITINHDDAVVIEPLSDMRIVFRKIFPGTVFLSLQAGYVCCFKKGDIIKLFYENSDEIPYEKKIFTNIPAGQTIRLDSGIMKQVFKKKSN